MVIPFLLVLTVVILVVGVVQIINIANNFYVLKTLIERAESNIDVLISQRFDELKKLLAVAREYEMHESTIISEITEVLRGFQQADTIVKRVLLNQNVDKFTEAFQKAVANIPELRASENYLQIQSRISELETSISDRYEHYNDSVTKYNANLSIFPNNIIGRIMGLDRKILFKFDEDKKNIDKLFEVE